MHVFALRNPINEVNLLKCLYYTLGFRHEVAVGRTAAPRGGGRGSLGISGWGCAAGTRNP